MAKKKRLLPENIDVGRLVGEITVVAIIVIVGIIIYNLVVVPKPEYDQYAKYKKLYEEVLTYDFSKGRSEALEARFERAMKNAEKPSQYYYYAQAELEYYYRLGNCDAVLRNISKAERTAYDVDGYWFVYGKYINCYHKQGRSDKEEEYQQIVEDIFQTRFPIDE